MVKIQYLIFRKNKILVQYIMPKKYGTYKKGNKTMFRKKPRTVDAKQNTSIRILKKKVKALEAPIELKFRYSTIDQLSINSLATAQTLNLIRPWDSAVSTANEDRLQYREGDDITMKKFLLRGKLEIPYPPLGNSVSRQMPTRCRMIYVYYPEQPPGNNINDILEIPLVPSPDLVDCFYKRNGRLKYRILKDVTYSLEPNYWSYADAVTPTADSFSGMASTKPAFITLRHTLNLSKLPNSGKCNYGQGNAGAIPVMGEVVLYTMTDNINYEIQLKSQTQITWLDQ
jgi:hypothetical protein